MIVEYKIKTATERDIFLHLDKCSGDFIPPLFERVDICEYAKKIFRQSVTFEAWEGQTLVGIVAAYFNNRTRVSAFITNVSVFRRFTKSGIASKLLGMCIEYAGRHGFQEIALEVHRNNHPAVRFYKKSNFEVFETMDEVFLMKRKMEWTPKETTTGN